jgi:DNA-binding transcriptional LysR family regulator
MIFTHPPHRRFDLVDNIRLVNDPLVVVLHDKHRLAAHGKIALDELANEPWVMFPRENDPLIYDRIITLCQSAGFSPRIVHETGHMLTRLGLVASGYGVHLVHDAWRTMPYPGIAYVPVEPSARISVCCFWRRDNDNVLVRNMIEIARSHRV